MDGIESEKELAEKRLKVIHTNREDFMKRWFAIAISVGFATALSNMPWLRDGAIFDQNRPVDWEQIKQVGCPTCYRGGGYHYELGGLSPVDF